MATVRDSALRLPPVAHDAGSHAKWEDASHFGQGEGGFCASYLLFTHACPMRTCPKCQTLLPADYSDEKCPSCGVYFNKYLAAQESKLRQAATIRQPARSSGTVSSRTRLYFIVGGLLLLAFIFTLGRSKNSSHLDRTSGASGDVLHELGLTREQVCRATIGAVMGQAPGIINAAAEGSGIVTTNYRRPSDGSEWRNVCKTDGKTVTWAVPGGRWRTLPEDGSIHLETTTTGALVVRQIYSDGSQSVNTYPLEALR